MSLAASASWVQGCVLGDTARKASYGTSYMRAVAAQSGWSTLTADGTEDVEAIDLSLKHEYGSIGVQVKCGTKVAGKKFLTVPIEKAWWPMSWARQGSPVYLVYVSVPSTHRLWIESGGGNETMHRSAAFWVRVDSPSLVGRKSVRLPLTNRFSADTLATWYDDWLEGFTGSVA